MRTVLCLLAAAILFLGGCTSGENQDQVKNEVQTTEPDVRAFKDPFTKKFLTSTKEVLPGYYLFKSKTGNYEMAFPAGGVIGERSYDFRVKNPQKGLESFMTTVHVKNYDPIKELSASLKINYLSYYDKETIEASLDSVLEDYDNKLVLNKLALKDRDIYWSTYFENEYEYYGVAGYAQNTVDTGGIYYSYEFTCELGAEKCQQLGQEFKQKVALKWVKQIHFK